MIYRPEIDGLRALSVIVVVFFHAGFEAFGGGFVGVDVFFVISGYLITTLILLEKQTGNFSLKDFYERRARRILPAMFLVLAASIPAALLLMFPRDVKDFSESLLAAISFTANFYFSHRVGYFDTNAEMKPLLHIWSVAVEEQYYLFFPLLLIVLWNFARGKIFLCVFLLTLLSLLVCVWASINKPVYAYFLLPTRAWELMVGSLVALILNHRAQYFTSILTLNVASTLGLLLICLAVVLFTKQTPFPSLYTLLPVSGTVLILVCATPVTIIGKLLSLKALVKLGLISYSIYLWHQPIFSFARHTGVGEDQKLVLLALALLSVSLAYATWKWIERPMRSKSTISSQNFILIIGSSAVILLSAGWLGSKTQGFENHYIEYRLTSAQRELYKLISTHTRKDIQARLLDEGGCQFWNEMGTLQSMERFNLCHKKFGPAAILIGDSHAMNMHNIISKSGVHPFLVSFVQAGCRPNSVKKSCQYDQALKFIESNSNLIKAVFFHQSGSYLMRDRYGKSDSNRMFEPSAPFILDDAAIASTVNFLTNVSRYTAVTWLGPFVEARVDFSDLKILSRPLWVNEKSIQQFRELDKKLSELSTQHAKTYKYLSLEKIFAIDADFLLSGKCITYNDSDHFSACGEEILSQKVIKFSL